MKKLFIFIIILSGLSIFSSCKKDFLQKDPLAQLSQNTFWKTQSDADLALAGCYNFLCRGHNATSVSNAGAGFGGGYMFWETLTDNGYTISSGGNFSTVSTGNIEATMTGIISDAYKYSYQAIATCNLFLVRVGDIPLTSNLRNQYIGEVKFIRAYHYFLLSQLYGDCVLTLKPLSFDQASITIPRSPKSLVVDSILADLDYAAANLPNTNYNGHAVRGTALAYKAKVLLANGQYQKAADAAKLVITENKFKLADTYSSLFLKPGQNNNPEIMFSARYSPPSFYSPQDWLFSYLNNVNVLKYLVDDYECTDGLPIQSSPLFSSTTPYVNRDPRLKMSIIVPGDWRGTTASTAFDPKAAAVPSGFLPRKGIDPNRFPTTYATQSDQDWVLMRYADVLLMYAEAQNEVAGPDGTVYAAINAVRTRPDVNMPQIPSGLSAADMRTRIRHERRIEFAMEGQRFFDLKRWRFDRTIIPTIKDPNNAYRSFPLRDTIWPIPQSEIEVAKSVGNIGFKQNPGY
ncbi:RagB/SusD family nutrient uptake outer membrane protein [Pedobacter nutrimenti]|uniref:RagB/SusD family nutrient uptake outer membrane protein n=1 Tax=Pedobacter nutrimenti TaxID=1241337 RepID=UPI00292CB1D5|nr:RagB/SusD family nutrient uptake outer membrane protein [Pedobacter nutrimenti]